MQMKLLNSWVHEECWIFEEDVALIVCEFLLFIYYFEAVHIAKIHRDSEQEKEG